MKKLFLILAILTTASTSRANLYFDSVDPAQSNNGYYIGVMNMDAQGIESVQNGSFSTFCLEMQEDIYLNRTYQATVNTAAVTECQNISDPLSPQTAWLYDQYLSGSITTETPQQAADMQVAIWLLEDEPVTSFFDEQIITPEAINLKNSALNSGATTLGNVRVLNVTENGQDRQDVLVKTIPEPASVVMLVGLTGLYTLTRKQRRAIRR